MNLLLVFVIVNLILSLAGYVMIQKRRYFEWTVSLYAICLEIMAVGTICLGFGYGFHLYSISMTTVAFYIYYMGKHLETKRMDPMALSAISVVTYFACYAVIGKFGVYYTVNESMEKVFFVYNSISVFTLLIIYMRLYITTILDSEKKLAEMAHRDKLTGLYNRHFLLEEAEKLDESTLENRWISIVDIDNFKKVNDTYGHDFGDLVLKTVAQTAQQECGGCTVCRWGGEEFVILSDNGVDSGIMERLRNAVSAQKFTCKDGVDFSVTITAGVEKYADGRSIDEWISAADEKLYFGKTHNKDQIVY